MKKLLTLLLLLSQLLFLAACAAKLPSGKIPSVKVPSIKEEKAALLQPEGTTLQERIGVPQGFARVKAGEGSFAEFLRNQPLKEHGAQVLFYNGEVKNRNVHAAVLTMDVGNKDLQQCADAAIRLRAEYLYAQKKYEKIHFNFTSGFRADYRKWREGYRIAVNGNNVSWVKTTGYSSEYGDFRKYLDRVFTYAGTLSLAKELKPVELEDMKIGDVFIQGGSPGHCVIVMDMAVKEETGEKIFLLAQSYMPAQDIHILINPHSDKLNPWYSLNFGETLITPEWTFKKGDLKRFTD